MVVTNIEGNVATLTNDYPTTESTIVLDIPNVKKDTQYSLYVVVTNQIGDSPKSAFTGLCKLNLATELILSLVKIITCLSSPPSPKKFFIYWAAHALYMVCSI